MWMSVLKLYKNQELISKKKILTNIGYMLKHWFFLIRKVFLDFFAGNHYVMFICIKFYAVWNFKKIISSNLDWNIRKMCDMLFFCTDNFYFPTKLIFFQDINLIFRYSILTFVNYQEAENNSLLYKILLWHYLAMVID